MARTYKVQIVSEKEWTRLLHSDPRYRHGTDSLGFADPVKRVGYVRDTAHAALNRYLLNHEFEHLVEEKGTDEDEFGIRHKRGSSIGRVLGALAAAFAVPFTGGGSLIPFALAQASGQALGSTIGGAATGERALGKTALQGAASGLGTGAGAGVGGALGLGHIGTGIAAGVGGAGGQALGGLATGQGTGPGVARQLGIGGAIGGATSALGGALSKSRGGAAPVTAAPGAGVQPSSAIQGTGALSPQALIQRQGLGSILHQQPLARTMQGSVTGLTAPAAQLGAPSAGLGGGGATALSRFRPPTPPGLQPPTPQPPTPPGAPPIQQTGAAAGNPLQNMVSGIGSFVKAHPVASTIGLGAGIAGAGDLFAPKPEAPDFGAIPSVMDLKSRAGAGNPMSALGALGQQQLTARLGSSFQGLEPGVEQSIRNTFQAERRNLISQFKAIRPNADLTSDSAYRQALFELDQQGASAVAGQRQVEHTRFQNTRTQDIQSALGIDEQTLNTMIMLAQQDVATVMARLGVSAAEAQQFKQTWGQLGAAVVGGAFGQGAGTTINIGTGTP